MAVTGSGVSLGTAHATVTLDLAQMAAMAQRAKALGADIEKAMGGISTGAKKAEGSLKGLGATLSQLGGAIGLTFGAAGAVALGRFALQADAVATAYKRQQVAALSLAGSQAQLNELLAAYEKATGGAIDRATALSDVTRLQAVGFGDSAAELSRFATAARGISVATGNQQDYVISQLQLAIANQSMLRLDQLGLGVGEVTDKIKQLQAADSSLTKEMAYQNAILGIAEQKYGALARSVVAQATGAEKAAKAWKDFRLVLGESTGGALGSGLSNLASQLTTISGLLQGLKRDADLLGEALRGMGIALPDWLTADPLGDFLRTHRFTPQSNTASGIPFLQNSPGFRSGIPGLSSSGSIGGGPGSGPRPSAPIDTSAADALAKARLSAERAYHTAIQQIDRQAATSRLDATRQYESQRTETIRQYESQRAETIRTYEQGIARDAEDFAIARARAAQQLAAAIGNVQEEAIRREADWREQLDERIGDMREDAAERVEEIEEQAAERRERSARDHRNRLLDAAARLDAVAIVQEQRRYADEQADAKQDLDKRLEKEKENLQESIDEAQKAHDKQVSNAREADQRRIDDMTEALAEAQRIEDEDRALRAERAAEDQARQLEQMAIDQARTLEQQATAHGLHMAQIDAQAAEERQAALEDHLDQMADLGIYSGEYLLALRKRDEEAVKFAEKATGIITELFDKAIKAAEARIKAGPQEGFGNNTPGNPIRGFALGGPVLRDGLAFLHAGERVLTRQQARAGGRSVTVGSLNIYPLPHQSATDIAGTVRAELIALLDEVGGTG